MYGPSYGRPHALKAKAKAKVISSSKEEEESDCSSNGAEEICRELAMLVRKFQKFSKKSRYGKSSKYGLKNTGEASARDYKKRTCHKCKKSGHYIADCPLWEKESKKKKKSRDDDSDDKKKKSSKSSTKSSSRKKSSSGRACAFIGKEMDSEEDSDHEEAEESEEESDTGVASLALTTEFVSKSIFNPEDNGVSTNGEDCADDYAPTYCFMAKGAKVTSREAYFETSSDDDSECDAKPSYKKLAKIATQQESAIEKIQKLLGKSNDLLDEEMDRNQTLSEELRRLKSKYEKLESLHVALSPEHEKLSYEFLQRKQDLEKLRESHDDLQKRKRFIARSTD
jgi:hypothetical protein